MYVPRGQIAPSTFAEILMFYAPRTSRSRRQSELFTASCLNTGFLIGGDDELRALQRFSVPEPGIKIEDTSCFGSEIWISGKDPTSLLPRTKGIATQPTPEGRSADLGDDTWAITSWRISASDSRESGSPRRCGSSQARAFTCTTTLGGKEGGTPAPRLLLEAR